MGVSFLFRIDLRHMKRAIALFVLMLLSNFANSAYWHCYSVFSVNAPREILPLVPCLLAQLLQNIRCLVHNWVFSTQNI